MRGHDLSNRVARLERQVAYLLQFAPKTVTAGVATFALTGSNATLINSARFLDAGAASYAMTGQAATLRRSLVVAGGATSYALSGQTAALNKGIVLAADAASFALAGADAGFAQSRAVSAEAASFSLTGQDATLGSAASLVAEPGSYSIAGSVGTLRHGRLVVAGAASFSLAGQAASTLRKAKVTAAAGSFALTGQAATLTIAAGGPACSYEALVKSASSGTSYTFNSTAIGTASSDRVVVLVITTNNGNVSGVTIGGVSATAAVTMANGDENVCIYYLGVTSGTTANIVVSTSSALCCAVAVYRLTGLASSTPVTTNSASNLSAGTGSISANVNVAAGDVLIAGSVMNAGSATATWVGVTERFDENYGSSEYTSGGFTIAGSTESPRSVNVTPSASAKRAIAAAVWR